MTLIKWSNNNKPGKLITKIAVGGTTTEEIQLLDNTFTHKGKKEMTQVYLEWCKFIHETIIYQCCHKFLKYFLEKRGTQVKNKVKPRVRLIQKASDSGGFQVSCLATGFYPRHINLTLLRDGQPVSDHEVTGGDLLPNGDGTFQMRKSLEIRAEERQKNKYTCSATHLSLDNKLIVPLDFDPGEPFKSVIPAVLIVLSLVLVFITGFVLFKCRKRRGKIHLITK
nr:major histocompatibility complex class I-related gene protein-like [Danio rerio]|eukprot:XP_021326457.1 major histocompatibility complex class I-related gene protein-like [Danio rerio]